jgi:GNAT superfamily N-acetyltransferase
MSGTTIIRLATSADIPAIQALISRSVRALSDGIYTPDQIDESLVSVFGVDSQLIADETYFVVDVDGVLAASGGWSKRETLYGGDQTKGVADPLLNPATDAARIRAFFVAPEFARRGLARLLFEHCERVARLAGFQRLQLGATLPGVPLYLALGFREIGRVESPMRFGLTLPIVRMEREIQREIERELRAD